jgi:hypothetical protein
MKKIFAFVGIVFILALSQTASNEYFYRNRAVKS